MQIYRIDLSKDKFDVNFLDANGKSVNQKVKNSLKAIQRPKTYLPEDLKIWTPPHYVSRSENQLVFMHA